MNETPKRRGRPPKVKEPEATSIELKVAELLANSCGIPGCAAKNHLEDARTIVSIIRE